jgi:hypothetical protein
MDAALPLMQPAADATQIPPPAPAPEPQRPLLERLRVTPQALTVAVSGLLLSFLLSYMAQLAVPWGWAVGLLILPLFLLGAYSVNCMVVGDCVVWAWILTALYVVNVLLTALVTVPKFQKVQGALVRAAAAAGKKKSS